MLFCLILSFAVPSSCQSVTVPQKSYEVTEGGNVTLVCNYETGDIDTQDLDPALLNLPITWTKNGQTVAESTTAISVINSALSNDNERISIVEPASLMITRVIDEDAGDYSCRVRFGEEEFNDTTTLHVLGMRVLSERTMRCRSQYVTFGDLPRCHGSGSLRITIIRWNLVNQMADARGLPRKCRWPPAEVRSYFYGVYTALLHKNYHKW